MSVSDSAAPRGRARLLPSQLGWHACSVCQSAAFRRYYRSRFLGFWRVWRHALHGASTTVVARPRMSEADAGRSRRPLRSLAHAPQRIRTSNLRFRRPMLYPVELGALAVFSAGRLAVALPASGQCPELDSNQHEVLTSPGPQPGASANSATRAGATRPHKRIIKLETIRRIVKP